MSVSDSSIRVSSRTRRRVRELARRMRVATQQELIDRALDRLEHELFWKGFSEEATKYLKDYAGERIERDRYGQTSANGLKRKN